MTRRFIEEGLCNQCKKFCDRSDFRLDSRTGYIKDHRCEECRIANAFGDGLKLDRDMRYRLLKKNYCEKCGFKGHKCQLDVDHVDENKHNNAKTNLMTLCANCHRLKTFNNRKTHPLKKYYSQ